MRTFTRLGCAALLYAGAFGQSTDTKPEFEIADVHASPKTDNQPINQFMRSSAARGRYEVKNATMVDLIRSAYGYDPDKILGGPNWLELDRFDIAAKMPEATTPDDRKLMLQALLADRFRLVLHKDSKPLPTYALIVGKKPSMKEATGEEQAGCRPDSSSGAGPPPEGGRLFTSGPNGPIIIDLGPGGAIHFTCRNMTMAAFASGLRGMPGVGNAVGTNPVMDDTGLKGAWNFDLRFSLRFGGGGPGSTGQQVTIFEAVEKQLGLKLEERQVPTPVLIVESADRRPGENPPAAAEALPPVVAPTEFEVADIKPTDPSFRGGNSRNQPGGRFSAQGMSLRTLSMRAFNLNNRDALVGLPAFADSERYDINAKAPSEGPAPPSLDPISLSVMFRNLLVDRFKLKYHEEQRQLAAYTLVASKPKMNKADPQSRIFCKQDAAPPGSPGNSMLTCQNITMALFAARLQFMAPALSWPVLDSTGIDGGWDFNLIYSPVAAMAGGGRGDANLPGGAVPAAAEPSGMQTIFEAVERQLGLKLESQKRSLPVIVIDHIEPKPTDN